MSLKFVQFAAYVNLPLVIPGDTTCGQKCLYQLGMTGIPIYNVCHFCPINRLRTFVILDGKYSDRVQLSTKAKFGGLCHQNLASLATPTIRLLL